MTIHDESCQSIDNHHVCDGTTFLPCDCGADGTVESRLRKAIYDCKYSCAANMSRHMETLMKAAEAILKMRAL